MAKVWGMLLLLVTCLPAQAVQWVSLALPAPANGAWQQAGDFLYLAGNSQDKRSLTRVNTKNWQAALMALPKDGDRFCTLDDGRLLLFARDQIFLGTASGPKALGSAPSIWRSVAPKKLHKVDWCQGNRLFVPDFDALRVYSVSDNGLTLVSTLPVSAFMELRQGDPSYSAKALFLADINLDGKPDLLVEDDNGLSLYLAKGAGFESRPLAFAPALNLTPLAKRMLRVNDGEDFEKLRIRTIASVTDLDGDGLSDLIVSSVQSKSLLDQNQSFEVRFGIKTANGLGFAVAPDTALNTEGVVFKLNRQDLDGDGHMDLYTPSVKLGVGKIVSALLTGSVSVALDIRRLDGRTLVALDDDIDADMDVSLGSGEFSIPLMAATELAGGTFFAIKDGDNKLALYRFRDGRLKRDGSLTLPLPKDGSRWQQGKGWLAILPGPSDGDQTHILVLADKLDAAATGP